MLEGGGGGGIFPEGGVRVFLIPPGVSGSGLKRTGFTTLRGGGGRVFSVHLEKFLLSNFILILSANQSFNMA